MNKQSFKEKNTKPQITLAQIQAVRKQEYNHALSRLERFAQQASPKLTAYNDMVKSTVWFGPDNSLHKSEEPMNPHEKLELDAAMNTIRIYEEGIEHEYQEEMDEYYAMKITLDDAFARDTAEEWER